jgi:hypothetical protein
VRAGAGDRLTEVAHEGDEPYRDGEILEVRGQDGAPPYLVRCSDNDRVVLVSLGLEAHVEHYQHST